MSPFTTPLSMDKQHAAAAACLCVQTEDMLGGAPEDVASFLAKTEGLDKTLIGDYLGEREDFNLKVMHAYVDALDFSGLEFDTAIRTFLQVGR